MLLLLSSSSLLCVEFVIIYLNAEQKQERRNYLNLFEPFCHSQWPHTCCFLPLKFSFRVFDSCCTLCMKVFKSTLCSCCRNYVQWFVTERTNIAGLLTQCLCWITWEKGDLGQRLPKVSWKDSDHFHFVLLIFFVSLVCYYYNSDIWSTEYIIHHPVIRKTFWNMFYED